MRNRADHTPVPFEDADHGLLEVLDTLQDAKNYSGWIQELIAPHINGRILEVGAGRGTYSTFFADRGHLTALEPSAAHCEVLRERLHDYPSAVVINAQLDGTAAPGSYDTVVCLNVLEHIADDHRALNDIYEALAPGGKIILWVPAFEALYSSFDRQIGHFRRYRRNELQALIHNVGFQQVAARYTNLPGFFAWWMVVKMLRIKPTAGRLSAIYDRWFIPVIRRVERFARPPLGQSLLVVAQRS
jgi:SAM-dependent methyltransferase